MRIRDWSSEVCSSDLYTIDTVLLIAALMLMTLVQQYPFVDAWLTVKVLLLVVYIALGIYAFRSRRSRAVRFAAWLAALAVFGFIVSVARAHAPLVHSEERRVGKDDVRTGRFRWCPN